MNKPMTTEELFNKICNILKAKGRLPDILEYESATRNPVPIMTYACELGSKLTSPVSLRLSCNGGHSS